MTNDKKMIQDASEVDLNLLRMLDRGLEDIETGRTLSHNKAMAEVRRIREARRFARTNTGSVTLLTDPVRETIMKQGDGSPFHRRWWNEESSLCFMSIIQNMIVIVSYRQQNQGIINNQ